MISEIRDENFQEIPSSIPQTRTYPERQPIGTPPLLNLDQSSHVITDLVIY